jgi:hypothetical protein
MGTVITKALWLCGLLVAMSGSHQWCDGERTGTLFSRAAVCIANARCVFVSVASQNSEW